MDEVENHLIYHKMICSVEIYSMHVIQCGQSKLDKHRPISKIFITPFATVKFVLFNFKGIIWFSS